MSFFDKPTLSADNGSFFPEKPSLSDRKTYFIWDEPTLSNYCDNGFRVNCLYHIFSQKWNARNKQIWRRPKLFCDSSIQIVWFYKNFWWFVNDPIKGDFQKTLLPFQIGRKSLVEYKWPWLHTTRKSLPGLSFMIVTKRYNIWLFMAMYLINSFCW